MPRTTSTQQRSSRACAACQKYKRRCDKTLPSCSLCDRLHKTCDYSDKQTENSLRTRIQELEALVASQVGGLTPESAAASSRDNSVVSQPLHHLHPAALRFQSLFLDVEIRTRPDAGPPPAGDLIPPSALCYLGDQAQRSSIMSTYFETVHQWMPIVGKIRMTSLANAESEAKPRADFALLILAMRLVQSIPKDTEAALHDPLYTATKEFAAKMDIAGVYSLLKLQANALIAVYEMGHGIFPSGYTSMGYCVTQAMALGIHNKDAPQILDPPRTWMDWEERQRVWWLIVILDRYLTAVGNSRPLLSADPKSSSHLPADDKAWDAGESVLPERLFLASSKQLSASPFARLAQAAHLLGEVVKHCNDDSQQIGDVQKEVELLSQALLTFLEIFSKDEADVRHFYSAIGVCLSGLLKLSNHHACESFAIHNDRSLTMAEVTLAREIALRCQGIMKETLAKTLTVIEILTKSMEDQEPAIYANISPWFLDCVYQALANLIYLESTAPHEVASKYGSRKEMCAGILRRANMRWTVAGAYLKAADLVEHELRVGQY